MGKHKFINIFKTKISTSTMKYTALFVILALTCTYASEMTSLL